MMSAALKRRDEELRQVQHELLQAERLNAAGRMIAKVAKSLAGPVEACYGLARQTLAELPAQSEQRALQERIASEAHSASSILENLVRVAEGKAAGQSSEAVTLEALVADVMVSAGPLLERRGLAVATDLGGPHTGGGAEPGAAPQRPAGFARSTWPRRHAAARR